MQGCIVITHSAVYTLLARCQRQVLRYYVIGLYICNIFDIKKYHPNTAQINVPSNIWRKKNHHTRGERLKIATWRGSVVVSTPAYHAALDISTGPLARWPAGPAHFSDRRASSSQYILSFTGPYGPPRYMSGHHISNRAPSSLYKVTKVTWLLFPFVLRILSQFRSFP